MATCYDDNFENKVFFEKSQKSQRKISGFKLVPSEYRVYFKNYTHCPL